MQKIAGRWVLVTPANHPYWMLGVFNVDTSTASFHPGRSYRSEILAKYGSEVVWARQAVRRLRGWGFNCLAEYAGDYVVPVPMYGRNGNQERLPFMAMIRPAAFSLTNRWNYAHHPVKDIVAATDAAVYTGWRGDTTPDVFDPEFEVYASAEAADVARRFGGSSYLVGVTTDDTDDLFGFGPGPDVAAARTHPHIGWLIAIANSQPRSNARLGVQYTDTRLYSKLALSAWLRQRYGSLARLNQAWNARYTSFDSDGGWPQGRGFLDESGRHAWMGRDAERLTGTTPALQRDLDEFLFLFATTYFQAAAGAVRMAFPQTLVFGPATLNGWNGLSRAPILKAAGVAVDVLQANLATAAILTRTVAAAGDVPIVTWTGIAANRDSDLFAYPNPGSGAPLCETQAMRGALYRQAVLDNYSAAVGGTQPVVGTKFWAFADSWAEKMNWGLVSFRDNAYDGQEAVCGQGHDRWGFLTGGELRNFGDCMSVIERANAEVYGHLRADLKVSTGGRVGAGSFRG